MKNIKTLAVLQYSFLILYLLSVLFFSTGTMTIDLDIYYFRAPDSGGFGGERPMTFEIAEKLFMTALIITEIIFVHTKHLGPNIFGIVLCAIRNMPASLITWMTILLAKDGVITVKLNIFGYLFVLAGIASFVIYILKIIALIKLSKAQVIGDNCV